MSQPRDELLDETTLRRALRFEPDEPLPRFDPAAIAAAAAGQRPRLTIASVVVALGVTAVAAVAVWSAAAIFLPAILTQAFDLGLAVVAAMAVPASTIVEIAKQPAVPLSLIAALAIATAYELSERGLPRASVR